MVLMLDARYDHDHEWEYCKLEVILIASKIEHCLICLMMEWEYCEPKANLMTSRTELGFMVCGALCEHGKRLL